MNKPRQERNSRKSLTRWVIPVLIAAPSENGENPRCLSNEGACGKMVLQFPYGSGIATTQQTRKLTPEFTRCLRCLDFQGGPSLRFLKGWGFASGRSVRVF